MGRPHVVVVGGGVSGLAAAWRLADTGEVAVTLLEGSPRLGGTLRSGEVAGVPVDLGAESVLARRPEALDLIAAAGLAEALVRPQTSRAAVVSRGVLRPLPPRTVFGVPGDLTALALSRILSPRGLARVALDRALPGTVLRSDVSVGSYVGKRLGRELVDRLVEPLLGGVYAGDVDRLSFAATMGSLVPHARRHRSLLDAAQTVVAEAALGPTDGRAGYVAGSALAGVAGGLGRLPERLAAGLAQRGATVRTRAMVRGAQRVPHGWRLDVGPGARPESLAADALVLAVPAAAAARLLASPSPGAARELDAIETASVAVVTFAFPASALPGMPVGSGFLVPAVEGGAVKAVTWSSSKWAWLRAAAPGMHVLRASLGRHGDEAVLQSDDAELAQLAAADLARRAGLRGSPLDVVVTRWGGALPQYEVGHPDRVQRVREVLARDAPGLAVCGASYDGVGIAACVAGAGAAADRLLRELAAGARMPP